MWKFTSVCFHSYTYSVWIYQDFLSICICLFYVLAFILQKLYSIAVGNKDQPSGEGSDRLSMLPSSVALKVDHSLLILRVDLLRPHSIHEVHMTAWGWNLYRYKFSKQPVMRSYILCKDCKHTKSEHNTCGYYSNDTNGAWTLELNIRLVPPSGNTHHISSLCEGSWLSLSQSQLIILQCNCYQQRGLCLWNNPLTRSTAVLALNTLMIIFF